MKLTVYAYRDRKAGAFGTPSFSPLLPSDQKEVIIRAVVKGQIKDSQDLELYHLGSFDDRTGGFELMDRPVLVLDLGSVIKEAA